jgi:hypothetical protein
MCHHYKSKYKLGEWLTASIMYSHSLFQCQLLQQMPEEKNKEHFELLALIATIQAKRQDEVRQVQQGQDSHVKKKRASFVDPAFGV